MPIIFVAKDGMYGDASGVLIEYEDGQDPKEGVKYDQGQTGRMRLRINALEIKESFNISLPELGPYKDEWDTFSSSEDEEDERYIPDEEHIEEINDGASYAEDELDQVEFKEERKNELTRRPDLVGIAKIDPRMSATSALSFFGNNYEYKEIDVILRDGGDLTSVSLSGWQPPRDMYFMSPGFELVVEIPPEKYDAIVQATSAGCDIYFDVNLKVFPNFFSQFSISFDHAQVVKYLGDLSLIENADEIPEVFLIQDFIRHNLIGDRYTGVSISWNMPLISQSEEEDEEENRPKFSWEEKTDELVNQLDRKLDNIAHSLKDDMTSLSGAVMAIPVLLILILFVLFGSAWILFS